MGTAVHAAAVRMPRVNGFAPPAGRQPDHRPGRLGRSARKRRRVYETYVSEVDEDGNEVAGIRLPPIAVPLGTYTGWNVYRAQPQELADRDGSLIPFARTRAERMAANDLRDSLEERYGSRDGYVAKVEAAAAALVDERLLLPQDAAAFVAAARDCDRFYLCPSPYPKYDTCSGIWSGTNRLIVTPHAAGHIGAEATSNGPAEAIGNDEPLIKLDGSTRAG